MLVEGPRLYHLGYQHEAACTFAPSAQLNTINLQVVLTFPLTTAATRAEVCEGLLSVLFLLLLDDKQS